MATASHHHHAMRSYLQCHNQPLDRSMATSGNGIHGGPGGSSGASAEPVKTMSLEGRTAAPKAPYFYPTTNQTTAVNKSNKKTWSQRLKLNSISGRSDKCKSEKPSAGAVQQQTSPVLRGVYADQWLYGTVRGMRPVSMPVYQQHALFYGQCVAPEVAVVVCCCPEYLNGTKKEVKKASVCKKCKGSRLPLAAIGGTVRLAPPTSGYNSRVPSQFYGSIAVGSRTSSSGVGRVQSSTVAIRSNTSTRPSILGDDPYAQMRRSRLEAPLLTSGSMASSAKLGRLRAKSSSPTRNQRSSPAVATTAPAKQVQHHLPRRSLVEESISSDADRVTLRSISMGRLNAINSFPGARSTRNQLVEDLWTDGHDDTDNSAGNRSILQCYSDLNPYDLVSSVIDTEEEEENHYDLCGFTSNGKGASESRCLESTEDRQNLRAQNCEIFIKPSTDTLREQCHSEGRSLSVSLSDTSPTATENRPQSQQKVTVLSHKNLFDSSTPQRPPRKFGVHVRLGPETADEEGKSDKREVKSGPVVKSILKKYENITFSSQDSCTETEDMDERDNVKTMGISDSECKKIVCRSKSATGLKGRDRDISNSSVQNKVGVHFTGAHRDSEHIGRTPDNSTSKSSALTYPRKKVQFCEEKDTFSHDDLDRVSESSDVGQLGHVDICKESQISNCRLVVGARKQNDNEEIGHNCDISAKEVPEHKSSEEDGAGQREIEADSSGVEAPGHDHQRVEADGVPVESTTSNPSARETSTLDVLLAGRMPMQDHVRGGRMVRRSLSDRKQRCKNNETEKNLFIDTMALRSKGRKDTRDVEFIPSDRPKDPPPPPPTGKVTDTPSRPPRFRKSSVVSVSGVTTNTQAYAGDDSYEYFNFDSEDPKTQQRHSFPISHPSIYSNAANRIVMPVLPTIRKDPSAIHRLEVKHEVDHTFAHKKTSIMIGGDGCYSTVNVNDDTPLYQSSVMVSDHSLVSTRMLNNTITINVGCHSEKNRCSPASKGVCTSVIPIGGKVEYDLPKTAKTLINLDSSVCIQPDCHVVEIDPRVNSTEGAVLEYCLQSKSNELDLLLRDPVEAVRLNLVPHICGKLVHREAMIGGITDSSSAHEEALARTPNTGENYETFTRKLQRNSFISKLLQDPTLGHLAEGLDNDIIAKLIESSLVRLKESLAVKEEIKEQAAKDSEFVNMSKLIDVSLTKLKEEQQQLRLEEPIAKNHLSPDLGSISSGNSFSSTNYEMFEFDHNPDSDCYQSCSSEITTEDDSHSARSKFYQMLVDATLSEIEISTTTDDDHHYESIRLNNDPIYEEISEIPPPLPLSSPPVNDLDKKQARSMFEGATKYDILSYLVDAKERGLVPEESYAYSFGNTSGVIIEEETAGDDDDPEGTVSLRIHKRQISDVGSRISDTGSDDTIVSSETIKDKMILTQRKSSSDIERNDSGVGSETSKSSRSKFLNLPPGSVVDKNSLIHVCEDCDGPVETQITDAGVMYAPLVCRKCGKKRAERKEIITEVVETEEKYGRDLQIILEEFYQPMLVAGLLTQEQLSAIFLNTEELLENNQSLAERMRDALEIASEQGDDDLLSVNIGKLFLDATPMLHAFETYCVGQAGASLLLANLEKEKELLRIFLRVSQMENSVLRRMNLNSFLMVPVQRVTKYPLLLARLYKVTPPQLDGRLSLKHAQEKIELHLNLMNQEAKDIPTKLWRRISSSSPGRKSSCEVDMINIKLRKMAIDVLEWNHDEVRFAMEGKLLVTQPTDNNWRKGRTIKLAPINALLVTHGKPSLNYRADRALNEPLNFPRHTGVREASLLLVREKSGRYTLLRDPLYLDRCVICSEADWADYFEVQEISSKDTFIFKAEDEDRTKQWYAQLQYHSQGMGAWRKRRNALANIMINGMMMRS